MIIAKFLLGAFEKLIAPLLAYLKGRSDIENKHLKESNKRMANRPRTNDDLRNGLRKWRDKL